ncbi:MAG: hypothetical protein V3T21_03255 [Candidatus Margulisiibacteriota bacterium]
MAAYLRAKGKILNSINARTQKHWANRVLNGFGKAAHRVSFGRYTPGLTRQAYALFKNTSAGDKIDVKEDGFYRGGEKIAGNVYISRKIKKKGLPAKFQRAHEDTPETIAKYCRINYPTSFSRDLRSVSLYTLFLSIPDLFLRVYVSLTIPPITTKILCSGELKESGKIINWEHIPHNWLINLLPGRSSEPVCGPFPNGFSEVDFSSISWENPLLDFMSRLDKSPDLFNIVNIDHYAFHPFLIFFVPFFLGATLMAGKVFQIPKRTILAMVSLFAAGGLVQSLEVAATGSGTNYLDIGGDVAINLADLYICLYVPILIFSSFFAGAKMYLQGRKEMIREKDLKLSS